MPEAPAIAHTSHAGKFAPARLTTGSQPESPAADSKDVASLLRGISTPDSTATKNGRSAIAQTLARPPAGSTSRSRPAWVARGPFTVHTTTARPRAATIETFCICELLPRTDIQPAHEQ